MNSERPIIGITMGDAAGIGPEIVVKALSDRELRTALRCVAIGDAVFLRRVVRALNADLKIVDFGDTSSDAFEVFDLGNLPSGFEIGVDSAVTGKASAEYIETAVDLWREGKIDAVSTAPISKRAISLGGYSFPGHTEFLAYLTQTDRFAMSFFAGSLRVVLLSTHLSLVEAIRFLTTERLSDLITFADSKLSKLLGRRVSIAVAGLNPHASEGGMFGAEEQQIIIPAVESCQKKGIKVSGPYSPDTVFLRGHKGEFDAVVALYHDQATIAVKSLSFGAGVNVTLGLPLVRTSVDHGTAFDIAGRGVADASSMSGAIRLAAELVMSSQKAISI